MKLIKLTAETLGLFTPVLIILITCTLYLMPPADVKTPMEKKTKTPSGKTGLDVSDPILSPTEFILY